MKDRERFTYVEHHDIDEFCNLVNEYLSREDEQWSLHGPVVRIETKSFECPFFYRQFLENFGEINRQKETEEKDSIYMENWFYEDDRISVTNSKGPLLFYVSVERAIEWLKEKYNDN